MFLKVGKKKIRIKTLNTTLERLKSYRFQLSPITTGLYFPKKKGINTYFFCQRIDIFLTDEKNKILYLYPSCKSEKIIFHKRKVRQIYLFPVGVSKSYKVGDTLKIEEN